MKVYHQVVRHIEKLISEKRILPREPLPSIRSLSLELGVSKNSVIKAYSELETNGVITANERKGFFLRSLDNNNEQQPIVAPKKAILGATSLNIIGKAQREASVIFGSANPDTTTKGRTDFYRILNKTIRKEIHNPATYSHYQAPPGSEVLRQAIAEKVHSRFKDADPNEIIITHGAQEGISLTLLALCTQGDIVAVESPCFYGILQRIEALNLNVLEIPSNSHGFDLPTLTKAIEAWKPKVFITNPHANNPLGYIMSDEKKQALLNLASKHHFTIIEDDVFGELIPPNQRKRTLKSMDRNDSVILCNSFSKLLDPDIRVGWVVAGKHFERINYLHYVTTLATSGLTQDAVASWINSPSFEKHRKQVQSRYRSRKDLFIKDLKTHLPEGCAITVPEAGYLCWVTLPESVDGDRVFEEAAQLGISVTPGSLFGAEKQFQNCLRFNYSLYTGTDIQKTAIKTLSNLIKAHC